MSHSDTFVPITDTSLGVISTPPKWVLRQAPKGVNRKRHSKGVNKYALYGVILTPLDACLRTQNIHPYRCQICFECS